MGFTALFTHLKIILLQLGMTIFAQPADAQFGPTLMGQVLPGPIKNRVKFGFLKKTRSGLDFYKNLTQTRPA